MSFKHHRWRGKGPAQAGLLATAFNSPARAPSTEKNRHFPVDLAMPTEGWAKEAADTLERKSAVCCRRSPARPQACACELINFNWIRPW